MESLSRINKLAAIGSLALVSAAWAASQGPGRCCPDGRLPGYDPATETSYTATVEEVKPYDRGGRLGTGTHLIVKSADRTLDVYLGPAAYLTAQNVSFAKGDRIEITGSTVENGDGQAVIAREVKKGDRTITLRNARGVPKWSRGRWR